MGSTSSSEHVAKAPMPEGPSVLPTFEVMMTSESKPLVPGLRQRDGASDTVGNYNSSSDAGSSPGDCENQSSRQTLEQTQPPSSGQVDAEKTSLLRRSEWWNSAMVITGEVMGAPATISYVSICRNFVCRLVWPCACASASGGS